MKLKQLLDSLPPDKRAFVVAECSWSCEDPAVSRAFAQALAASGQEVVAEVLGTLVGGARSELEHALEEFPVRDTPGELPPILADHIDAVLTAFELSRDRSRAMRDRARTARSTLKANFVELEGCVTEQMLGVPFPGIKSAAPDATIFSLPAPARETIRRDSLFDAIAERRSVRTWGPGSISLPELSFLLWATQGLRGGRLNQRTVPSGGSRHPFETYVAAQHVDGLETGVWRYRPMEHDLVRVSRRDDLRKALTEGTLGQAFVGNAPLTFIWAAIPARTEWRYCVAAPKIILQDSGHLCQNLYLAVSAIGCGTCAIGAYDQEKMDAVAEVDGTEEMVVYCAPVGRLKTEP